MDRNFTPFPNLFFRPGSRRWRDFYNERLYMLNVQLHLLKYTQFFLMLLIVIKVVIVNFDEHRTACLRTTERVLTNKKKRLSFFKFLGKGSNITSHLFQILFELSKLG